MEASRFSTYSLKNPRIARILAAALRAVEPGAVVEQYLAANPLPSTGRIFAVGLGKAGLPMTAALSRYTNLIDALIITKHASEPISDLLTAKVPLVRIIECGHPLPDARSLAAGQAALDFISDLNADDLLVCLISGGGSALMTVPTLPLNDMQTLTSALLACGARIDEINTLRRHLDRVKGGGLVKATRARVLSLILSDVVGNPLEAIASGPTAPDPSTCEDALDILSKHLLLDKLPASIPRLLRTNHETLKPNDPLFSRVQNVIVGDSALAAQAGLKQAQKEGFHTEYLGNNWQGEARHVGVEMAQKLRVASISQSHPFCFIAGGETTVTIQGKGKGGRNQELALAAVPKLAGLDNAMLISLATDGEDGPTDAAGAVVTGKSLQRADSLGMDVADYLVRNDAYSFFGKLGDLLKIGSTGTNVNDLAFLLTL